MTGFKKVLRDIKSLFEWPCAQQVEIPLLFILSCRPIAEVQPLHFGKLLLYHLQHLGEGGPKLPVGHASEKGRWNKNSEGTVMCTVHQCGGWLADGIPQNEQTGLHLCTCTPNSHKNLFVCEFVLIPLPFDIIYHYHIPLPFDIKYLLPEFYHLILKLFHCFSLCHHDFFLDCHN